jgi:hypothetical protein
MSSTHTLATCWLPRPKANVGVDGTVLTSPSYTVEGWLDAVVPGSVLATLVKNKKAPDPYYGDYSKAIPDISKAGAGYYTYGLRGVKPCFRSRMGFAGSSPVWASRGHVWASRGQALFPVHGRPYAC